jgi:hypothetical protein
MKNIIIFVVLAVSFSLGFGDYDYEINHTYAYSCEMYGIVLLADSPYKLEILKTALYNIKVIDENIKSKGIIFDGYFQYLEYIAEYKGQRLCLGHYYYAMPTTVTVKLTKSLWEIESSILHESVHCLEYVTTEETTEYYAERAEAIYLKHRKTHINKLKSMPKSPY